MNISREKAGLLRQVCGLLEDAGIRFALFAGFAAVYYGSRRDFADFDIITTDNGLKTAHKVLELLRPSKLGTKREGACEAKGFVLDLPGASFRFCSALTIRIEGEEYSYVFDAGMQRRVGQAKIKDLRVPVLSPEDVVILYAILQRGPEQGKHDLADVKAVYEVFKVLDMYYVEQRARKCGAFDRVMRILPP